MRLSRSRDEQKVSLADDQQLKSPRGRNCKCQTSNFQSLRCITYVCNILGNKIIHQRNIILFLCVRVIWGQTGLTPTAYANK